MTKVRREISQDQLERLEKAKDDLDELAGRIEEIWPCLFKYDPTDGAILCSFCGNGDLDNVRNITHEPGCYVHRLLKKQSEVIATDGVEGKVSRID